MFAIKIESRISSQASSSSKQEQTFGSHNSNDNVEIQNQIQNLLFCPPPAPRLQCSTRPSRGAGKSPPCRLRTGEGCVGVVLLRHQVYSGQCCMCDIVKMLSTCVRALCRLLRPGLRAAPRRYPKL